jgi:hypothetical protein
MKDLYLVYVRQSEDDRKGFAGEVRANSPQEAYLKARKELGVTAPNSKIHIVRGVPQVEHQLDDNFARTKEDLLIRGLLEVELGQWADDSLDELVHELALTQMSEINTRGKVAQIEYIIRRLRGTRPEVEILKMRREAS